jgi:hypothetical protein
MGSASQQLSQLTDGGSLSLCVWPIFSYMLPCFGLWLPGSVLASLQSIYAFLTSGFFPYFLVSFLSLFMPEKIGLHRVVRQVGLL